MYFRGKQTCLDIQGPRFLGKGITRGTIYVSLSTGYLTELILLQGNDGISNEFRDEDKENRSVSNLVIVPRFINMTQIFVIKVKG